MVFYRIKQIRDGSVSLAYQIVALSMKTLNPRDRRIEVGKVV